jgi:hypothetical protein
VIGMDESIDMIIHGNVNDSHEATSIVDLICSNTALLFNSQPGKRRLCLLSEGEPKGSLHLPHTDNVFLVKSYTRYLIVR